MLARLVLQGLKGSEKLKHGALILYMGNEMRATVEAIESFNLILPSGLIIVLDNCHFAPTVTRGVVSISRLVKNGYIHTFTNYGIYISKDNVFYFNAIPHDGIYEIDMHNIYPNVSSNYNVSNKRAKHGLDSYYLWHCRLRHINKKRMEMLQRDGLLQPTHDESHEKYKSCTSGKMARKPFSHQVERAKDLLGLIHTDVCGPFKTVSREGANYFITFTDDFSRYGFVYLMKHKHEVFETFKVFQNEVENQLGKKIKAIQSDQGGEYLSHEFVNHMKSYGIYVNIEEYELGDLDEPPNYKDTLAGPKSDKCLEAMNTEMQSMKDNQIWILVELPPNGRTTGSKWLFKKKTDMDGNVHTFKARLVAKGYTQTYGVDYGENFSSVAYIRAIKIILAIAAFYNFEIWKMDVKTAFLNGHPSEDVYMVQLKGFDEEIKKIGFTQNPDEPCVYLKASGSNVAFLVLYVDDILLMGNNVTMLKEVKSWLCKCFSIKDLGEATYILRIKIIRDRSKRLIALNQSAYLEKILKKFRMENSKKGYTPMIKMPDYRKSQGAKTPTEVQHIQRVPYASAIGLIMNTKDMVLMYGAKPEDELKVSCYDDANSKYIVAAEASLEAVWMRKFIDGLGGVIPSNKRPIEMLCDNEHALAIAYDPIILKGAKHFQRKYH
ncbi:retrotransposon protein, putative, ty1-copia subclass [Tanacetum coccineum]